MNLENIAKNKLLIGALLVLVVLALSLNVMLKPKSNLLLEVSPRPATIVVDGKSKTKVGSIYLSPGAHSIKASMAGFVDQTQKVTTTKSGKSELIIILTPSSFIGSDWLASHYSEDMYRQGLASKSIGAISKKTSVDLPLLKELPYIGAGFAYRIDYGVSPTSSSNTQIIITAPDAQSQQDAVSWIKSKGYDPTAYDISYITSQP